MQAAGGLYDQSYEHDACGVAFVARLRAPASHEVVLRALTALEHMEHRGARGGRSRHGRRCGDPVPASRRLPARRGGYRASRAGPLRRGHVLPPAGRPHRSHAPARGQRRGGGPTGARLARGPRGRGRLRHDRPRVRAANRAAVHRGGRRRARPGRAGAQALRDPPRGRANRTRRHGDRQLLVAHDRLQGHAHRAPAAALLPGPARRARGEPPGAGALALLHQHLPELGARPPLPDARAQRRDQHAARQPQLDAGPRAASLFTAVRGRHREDQAAAARRHLRLGLARRPHGATRARRQDARARHVDADPGGLPGPARAVRGGA